MRQILTALFLLAALAVPALAQVENQTGESAATTGSANEMPAGETAAKDSSSDTSAVKNPAGREYFFLVIQGQGKPVREVQLNGVNVLGGSVQFLSMPINVSNQIKPGLNEVKVRYVSHETEGLVTIMEKRTSGPKRTELAKLVLPPNHSEGKEIVKELAFNVDPAPPPPATIELSQDDRKKILALVENYHAALKSKSAARLKALYAPALKEEQRIFPEGAEFFARVLNKEIALMRRKEIKMGDFLIDQIMLEQESDKIRAVRKDRKPMMESNEIEVEVEPFWSEIAEDGKDSKAGGKSRSKKQMTVKQPAVLAKQRLVTTTLSFRRIGGQWHLALPRGV